MCDQPIVLLTFRYLKLISINALVIITMHALIRCGFYSFGLQKLCFYTPDQFSSIPPAFLSFLQSFRALVFFSVYVSFSSAFRLLFVTQVFKRKGNASRFEPEFVSLPAGHFTTLGHIGSPNVGSCMRRFMVSVTHPRSA